MTIYNISEDDFESNKTVNSLGEMSVNLSLKYNRSTTPFMIVYIKLVDVKVFDKFINMSNNMDSTVTSFGVVTLYREGELAKTLKTMDIKIDSEPKLIIFKNSKAVGSLSIRNDISVMNIIKCIENSFKLWSVKETQQKPTMYPSLNESADFNRYKGQVEPLGYMSEMSMGDWCNRNQTMDDRGHKNRYSCDLMLNDPTLIPGNMKSNDTPWRQVEYVD